MKKVTIVSMAVIFVLTLSTCCFAQKVDFSGTWKYNTAKSEIPKGINIHQPEIFTYTHKDNVLSYKTGTGEKLTEMKYTLDGKKVINKSSKGTEITSFCKWDKETLIIETTRPTSYGDFKMKEKLSLSKDGKTLIKVMTTNMTFDQELKYVYDKTESEN